jgi:uncharacterized membrane protein YfcA
MGAADAMMVAVVILAGLMRGMTGFGGAMVMAPPLSLLLGPVPAVVIALTLEVAAALVVLREAWPKIDGRILIYLTLPAALTVPLGGYLLLVLDAGIARRMISAVVVLSSLALLSGIRYAGKPRPSTSVALGSVVGVLLGATSVGAPPVILYLLSGSDPPEVTRANLTVFVTAISVIGVAMLITAGAISSPLAWSALILSAPYLAATWAGGRLVGRLTARGARRLALGFMLVIGTAGLLA